MKTIRWGCLSLVFLAMSCGEDASDPASGISPTGTYLEPNEGLGEEGYTALDEVCEKTDAISYINRYVTPMFRDSAVVDNVVYLVDGSLLWAIDISAPSRPERLSLTRLGGHPLSLAVTGEGFLAVADGVDAVLLVDVSDPGAPEVIGTISDLPGPPMDVAAVGDTVYVAAGEVGLLAIDVADPSSPTLLSETSATGFANAVTVADDVAYMAACGVVAVFDVADGAEVERIGTVEVPEGHARELDVEGDQLLVAGGEALFSVDVSEPDDPIVDGFYTDRNAVGFYVNAVTVRDGVAYIAAGDESFRAVDIRRMSDISIYVSVDVDVSVTLDDAQAGDPPGTIWNNTGDPIGIALHEDLLLVLGNFRWVGERLLRILDLSGGGEPVDVGAYTQPNGLRGVDAIGDRFLVHGEGGEETVIDAAGETLDTFTLPGSVKRMSGGEDTHFFLLESGAVYRTTGLGSATRVATSGYDVAADDSLAVVSDVYENALSPLPVSDSGAYRGPLGLALDDAFLGFSRLAVADDRIYAYDWAMGRLHVAEPDTDGNLQDNGFVYLGQCEAYDVSDVYSGAKDDKSALLRNGDALVMLCPADELGLPSIRFIDISEPDLPQVTDVWALPTGRYADVDVTRDAVYVVGFDNNRYVSTLERFAVGDGGKGSFDSEKVSFDGRATGVAVVENDIVVADADFGIRRFTYTDGSIAAVSAEAEQ